MLPNRFPQKTFSPVTHHSITNLSASRNGKPSHQPTLFRVLILAGNNQQNRQGMSPGSTLLSQLPNLPGTMQTMWLG
jgi:hypothetical protein